MLANQPTVAEPSRQDPFRWLRGDIANALDDFANPDPPSQREYAQEIGVPHATFNYWMRRHSPAESDLAAFRGEEQPPLAQQTKPRTITLVPDEHFHSAKPCLVAIEPVSNFIAVECYRDRRDADTWKEAIQEDTRGMPVETAQLTSDLARALLCCAEKGL